MGALHAGHASLIRRAAEFARASPAGALRVPVTVTIFVNPTQFGPSEDFARYPRTLDADLETARAAGADVLFVPAIETIYPRGLAAARAQAAAWDLPPVATRPQLEDRLRPTHFGGVCLVVARLFELCRPAVAWFGEKDWQQLRVIDEMVELERARRAGTRRFDDLLVEPVATIRESDGLAMSSRNRYLGPEARHRATALHRALEAARERARSLARGLARDERSRAACPSGASAETTERGLDLSPEMTRLVEESMHEVLLHDGLEVDYAAVRDARTLLEPAGLTPLRHLRALIAARVDDVRLIDNASLA